METKAHTVKRFDAELEELNNNVVKMASAVEAVSYTHLTLPTTPYV